MAVLPPVEQVFTANADAFLATIDSMVAATDRLAESIDLVAASADRLGGGADLAAAGDARIEEAATAATAATYRQIASMDLLSAKLDEIAAASDRAAVAQDEQAAAADKTVAANDKSAGSAAGLASKGKVAFLAVAAAAVYSVVKAAEYQAMMTRLLTQAGVAKSQFSTLETGVLQLAGAVGFSPSSLGMALYHIESAFQSTGIKGAEALSLLKIAAEGAAVGHADLVDVTNALDATIVAGIPHLGTYSQAMGALNAIVGSGDMTMQDLADAMGTGAIAQAKLYGQSLVQVGAALAVFGDNNIRGAKAATDLRMTWQAMQAPMKAGVPVLQSIGLQWNSLANTMTHHGLSAAIGEFIGHLKASKVPLADWGQYVTEIFGKRAGTGIGVLIEQYQRLLSKLPDIKKGADTFGSAWTQTNKTLGQQWNDLKGNLDALAVSFGEVLLPAVTKIVTWINKLFQAIDKHPLVMKLVGALIALAAVTIMAAGAMAGLAAISDAIIPALIIAAVIALGVALYELYKHSKTVRDALHDVAMFFKSVWNDAVKIAGDVLHWFVNGPLKWLQAQLALFSAFWKQHGAELTRIAKAAWAVIADVVKTAWGVIWAVLKAGLDFLEATWKYAWALILGVVKTVFSVIGQVIHTAIQLILGIIGIGLDLLTGRWAKAGDDLRHLTSSIFDDVRHIIATIVGGLASMLFNLGELAVQGLINGIKAMIGAAVGAIKSVVGGIVGAAKDVLHIFSPSRVFYDIGSNITLGLSTGIINSIPQAVAAARRLTSEVYAAAASGQITGSEENSLLARIQTDMGRAEAHIKAAKAKLAKELRDWALEIRAGLVKAIADAATASAVKSGVDKLLTMVKDAFNAGDISYRRATRLTDFLERDNTRLQTLAAQRGTILKTIATAEKYATSTTSNVESWAGLANNTAITNANSAGGGLYSGDILSSMQASLTTIRQFTTAIKKLKQLGLSGSLLNQIIQMGPQQGLQVAQALIDGPVSVIRSMNTTQNAINQSATSLGQSAADAMYDSGKMAGRGFLSGLEAQQASIEKLMERIARRMVATLKRELGIRSPSTVGHYHGMMWVAGIAAGMDDGTPMIDAAGKRLALAMGHHPGPMLTTPGGGSGGGDTYHVQLSVNGFVGNNQELLRELTLMVQKGVLQLNKRNPGNPLSLSSGRYS